MGDWIYSSSRSTAIIALAGVFDFGGPASTNHDVAISTSEISFLYHQMKISENRRGTYRKVHWGTACGCGVGDAGGGVIIGVGGGCDEGATDAGDVAGAVQSKDVVAGKVVHAHGWPVVWIM